jgi:hypothetical protein
MWQSPSPISSCPASLMTLRLRLPAKCCRRTGMLAMLLPARVIRGRQVQQDQLAQEAALLALRVQPERPGTMGLSARQVRQAPLVRREVPDLPVLLVQQGRRGQRVQPALRGQQDRLARLVRPARLAQPGPQAIPEIPEEPAGRETLAELVERAPRDRPVTPERQDQPAPLAPRQPTSSNSSSVTAATSSLLASSLPPSSSRRALARSAAGPFCRVMLPRQHRAASSSTFGRWLTQATRPRFQTRSLHRRCQP